MLTFAIVPLALAASALANVFMTSPVASTTFTAGQLATVSWQDSGETPSLLQFGLADFAIYVGNAIQQTPLQMIATSVNVSSQSSFQFTPDGSIGPNSGQYFIRATSLSFMNPESPQYAEEAFSAKFTMAGMTGSFNATLQAEIDGQSTAPIGGTTAASSASGASTHAASPTTMVMSTTLVGSSGSSAPTTTASATGKSTNGAGKPVMATGLVVLVATLVGASFL